MNTSETPYSHPEESVRHSYPLAIEKAGVGQSFNLLMRTLPYAIVRLGILVAVSIATIIWIGSTVGISAWLGARVHEFIGGAWFIGGIGIYGYVWFTIVRYFLYLLKCGHIAVLTELITKNEIGNGGENMFQYGKNEVLTAVAFLILFLPAFGVAYLMPGSSTGIWAFFIAALFAFNVQTAILHPLFLIMIMTKFHVCVKNQPIDETWDGRLSKVSGKFQKIKDGVRDWDRNNKSEQAPTDEGVVTPPANV